MDIRDLMKQFGVGDDEIAETMNDPTVQGMMQRPEFQQIMDNPNLTSLLGNVSGMMAQGGIMPDDVDSMMESLGGMADMNDMGGMLSGLLGGTDYDEIDLDEEIEAYQPEPEGSADRKFAAALKKWIAETVREIPEKDVCMLAVNVYDGPDEEDFRYTDIRIAYNTAKQDAENLAEGKERWDFLNWTRDCFREIPHAPFSEWCISQGYDEESIRDGRVEHILDLAAVTVMELHREHLTEQLFGKKLPFVFASYVYDVTDYDQKTAIRAARVSGKELFDRDFYEYCGFEDDDEEAAE